MYAENIYENGSNISTKICGNTLEITREKASEKERGRQRYMYIARENSR